MGAQGRLGARRADGARAMGRAVIDASTRQALMGRARLPTRTHRSSQLLVWMVRYSWGTARAVDGGAARATAGSAVDSLITRFEVR